MLGRLDVLCCGCMCLPCFLRSVLYSFVSYLQLFACPCRFGLCHGVLCGQWVAVFMWLAPVLRAAAWLGSDQVCLICSRSL